MFSYACRPWRGSNIEGEVVMSSFNSYLLPNWSQNSKSGYGPRCCFPSFYFYSLSIYFPHYLKNKEVLNFFLFLPASSLQKCSHRNTANEGEVKISRNVSTYRCTSVPICVPDALPWLLSSILFSFHSLLSFSLFCKPILYQRLYKVHCGIESSVS